MIDNSYSGILVRPDIDFNEVRDGRRSALFYYDVDLSIARSVLLGTHLVIPVAGDSIYVDKNPLKVGVATVHFQDVTLGTSPAPVYCEPGFIAKVPFTQLLIENLAQPGKIFRFFYGVDIDFTPGTASTLTITGGVSISPAAVNVNSRVDGIAGAAGTTVIVLPATNLAGINFYGSTMEIASSVIPLTTDMVKFGLYAALAPVGVTLPFGANMISLHNWTLGGRSTAFSESRESTKNFIRVPSGFGLYLNVLNNAPANLTCTLWPNYEIL